MHDIVNHRAPEYLNDLFKKCSELNPHRPNTRESETNLIIPRIPRTEHYKESMSYRDAKLWNSLPYDLKTSNSKVLLKRKLNYCKQTVNIF